MLKVLGTIALVLAILIGLLGYLIHIPIPADTEDFKQSQILVDGVCIADLLAQIVEVFGYSKWLIYRQYPKPVGLPEDVTIKIVNLAGVESTIFTPKDFHHRSNPGPGIVFYHGGGWTVGNVEAYSPLLARMAEDTGLVVMSPKYRKAPENPFPIPYEDCLNSTLEFMRTAENYNVDPSKLALVGDSAGGNLAMAITIALQKMEGKHVFQPKMISLIYPALQIIDMQLPSYQENSDYVFCNNLLPRFWLSYMGFDGNQQVLSSFLNNGHVDPRNPAVAEQLKEVNGQKVPVIYQRNAKKSKSANRRNHLILDQETKSKIEKRMLDERFAPLMASDETLSKFPFTHIQACAYDPLRDDSIILAGRLQKLGVPHRLQYLPQSVHGSMMFGLRFIAPYSTQQLRVVFNTISENLKN